jgi:hypothetical protein
MLKLGMSARKQKFTAESDIHELLVVIYSLVAVGMLCGYTTAPVEQAYLAADGVSMEMQTPQR